MAEEFINEIYSKSDLIYIYRQCVELLRIKDYSKFSKLWSANSEKIIGIVNEIRLTDSNLAGRLESMIYGVINNIKDSMLVIELLDAGIIPILYQYMSEYCGIDVTEGEWQLKSSRSGYLTLYNTDLKCHIHGLDNPMWEARLEAKALYDGRYDRVLLMGGGLGYLAKALWELSEKSLDIYIFEKESKIEEYAHHYGVIDDIDENNIHYIVNDEILDLYCEFLGMQIGDSTNLVVMQDWMSEYFEEPIKSNIQSQIMSNWALISFKDNYNVNYWRNKKRFTGELSELTDKHKGSEFIVVAAGPSLDDCIEYIKENVGKKIIVCVNTVLKRMLREGIKPDYLCLLDPTVGVYPHVEGVEDKTTDIPLIAESVAYWKYINVYKGPIYRVFGANCEISIEESRKINESIVDIGSTVANLVIEVAVRLGAARVELVGMDLSFPEGRQYAGDKGTHGKSQYQREYYVKSVDGGMVCTADTYNIFRADIEKQIERYRSVEFENLSQHGAMINGSISIGWKDYGLHLLLDRDNISENNYKELLRIGGLICNIDEAYVHYRDTAQIFEELNSNDEKNEILKVLHKWHEHASVINDCQVIIFLDTVILEIEYDEEVMLELMNLIADSPIDYKGRYYWYCQIEEKIEAGILPNTEKTEIFLEILKEVIIEEITELLSGEIESNSKVQGENDLCYLFISRLTKDDITNGSDALSEAISFIKQGKKVLLINTAERVPGGLSIPIFNEVGRTNADEFVNRESIKFGGTVIPYFQCENCMPDIGNIKIMLQYIQKNRPTEVISFCSDSPLVWAIEQLL